MAFLFSSPEKQAEKAYQAGKSALYEKHDYAQAERQLSKAAQLGHAEGQRLYATLLFLYKKDVPAALEWMEKAAAQNEPHAVRRCVELYSGEDAQMGSELIDAEKALFWAQKARQLKLPDAEQLHRRAEASQTPAVLYDLALEQFQAYQYESALLTMERSAKQGYAPAMIWCGQKLEEGVPACEQSDFASIQPDRKAALQWYDKAAQLGDPEGQFQRGRLCERGPDGSTDALAAMEWYSKALLQGHAGAFSRFFALYPQHMWDAFEKRLADQWVQAAQAGDCWAGFLCAELRCWGRQRPAADSTLLGWCEAAARLGRLEAQFRLGFMLEQGLGTLADKRQAFYWYEKAGEQGHVEAAYRMGLLYYQGREGVAQDYAKALALFEAAAKQGHFPSAAYCGRMLLQGQGVGSDRTEALGWYRQAAFGMGVSEENLPEESDPISFQFLRISQMMTLCGQQALAYPLLKELAQNADYPTAFLLLAALYRQGIPGELAPEPRLAKECFSRWQNAVKPGDTLGFGSYPQHLEPYRYQQSRCFELTPWTVLEKRPGRVLLLCRLSLEYTAEGRLSFPLFGEMEQGLILEGPFPLSKQQFQTYLAEQKLDEAAAFASLYARMVKAQRVGIVYERTKTGVQFSTGNRRYTEEERREWEEATGWVENLSARTTMMLLSDGAAFGHKLLNFYSSDELTFRPAVWVGLPED